MKFLNVEGKLFYELVTILDEQKFLPSWSLYIVKVYLDFASET